MSNDVMEGWPSIREVAREMGVSEARIRQLVLAGRLAVYRTRWGYYLVDPASVRVYGEQRAAWAAKRQKAKAPA